MSAVKSYSAEPASVTHLGGQFLITCLDQGPDVHPNRRFYWQVLSPSKEPLDGYHAFLPNGPGEGPSRYMDTLWLLLQIIHHEKLAPLVETWMDQNAGGRPHEFPPFRRAIEEFFSHSTGAGGT